ncbi:MAG: hypothetical protein AAF462_08555 [Thermodesulfobacteriota bacterium]
MIGDGYFVGVSAEVFNHLSRSTKWPLGIDDPLFGKDLHGLPSSLEQKTIDHLGLTQSKRIELAGQGEDQMKIIH